ncbi:hypothetical protein RRG08_004290 [Elysia crispata]|uniref:Uncharacterized protein n=1 Tax=Elysia crispata TaxID=231223 RepID=A0AAE1CW60_9GAST|nr:hypothetical protein RRG08_004290 [Elysia crispata]
MEKRDKFKLMRKMKPIAEADVPETALCRTADESDRSASGGGGRQSASRHGTAGVLWAPNKKLDSGTWIQPV